MFVVVESRDTKGYATADPSDSNEDTNHEKSNHPKPQLFADRALALGVAFMLTELTLPHVRIA